MSNAAKRHRSKVLAAGSISVAAAVTAALASAAPAGVVDPRTALTLNGNQPAWTSASVNKGSVPAAKTITTRVYLTGQDQQGLAAAARAATDPNSAAYGKYLTPAQVQARFGATADQIAQVTSWLKHGLDVATSPPAGSTPPVRPPSPDGVRHTARRVRAAGRQAALRARVRRADPGHAGRCRLRRRRADLRRRRTTSTRPRWRPRRTSSTVRPRSARPTGTSTRPRSSRPLRPAPRSRSTPAATTRSSCGTPTASPPPA